MSQEFDTVPFLKPEQHRELVRRLLEDKADLASFEIIRLFQPALFRGPEPDMLALLLERFADGLLERHGLDPDPKAKMRLAVHVCASAIQVKCNLRLASILFETDEERTACACVLGDVAPPTSIKELRQSVAEITAKKPIMTTTQAPPPPLPTSKKPALGRK